MRRSLVSLGSVPPLMRKKGRWLLRACRAAAHVHLGFGSFFEYVERLFGYKPRSTQEKLRVAEALQNLPEIESALEQGQISWSAVRELTRVAVSSTEREWLAIATGKTLRQLEEFVAGRSLGDAPSTAPDPAALRHTLRFEVAAEAFAVFREAMAELRRRSDAALDDDSVLMEMARHVLAGPKDSGRSSYQIALSVCAECGAGHQPANGQLVRVPSEIVKMAECDAQQLPSAAAPAVHAHVGTRAHQDIPPALRRAVLHRDEHRCRIPGCKNATFLDVHHIRLRSEGGPHEVSNLLTVCSAHHRALHRGDLQIDGDAERLQVMHADGRRYGQPVSATFIETHRKVFSGLRGLGFREAEVRAVLADLRQLEKLATAPPQQWLREALRRLSPARSHSPAAS